jgi:hypothetical protein
MPDGERRLYVPSFVPKDFGNAVATVLLLGIAGGDAWDQIFIHPPEKSLAWIEHILESNEKAHLMHADITWWERQIRGH